MDAAVEASPPIASADRSTLPCGDAPMPHPETVKPGIWNIGIVRMANDALFVTASAQHMSVSPTGVANDDETVLGYFISDGAVTRVGDVGHAQRGWSFPGHGAVVIETHPPTPPSIGMVVHPQHFVCDAGTTATLPEDPHATSAQLAAAFVDGTSLTAVYVEPGGTRSSACRRLTSGTIVARQIFVERLNLANRPAGWKTVSSHNVNAPTGAGCRSSVPIAAAASSTRALVVLESCSNVDAGDSIAISDCSLSAERFADGAWQRFTLAGKLQSFNEPIASADAERVAVPADRSEATFRVYTLANGVFTAEGGVVDGYPIAIDGAKLARADAHGEPGPSGVGYRLRIDELSQGAWHDASDAIETTGRDWAVDLSSTPALVLADEQATALRLYTLTLGKWKRLGLLDLQ